MYDNVTFFVDNFTIFGDIMDSEVIPYALNSKIYVITEETDSLKYERNFIIADDVQAYVYCKPLIGKNSQYSISSRPCPCVSNQEVLINDSVRKVFIR